METNVGEQERKIRMAVGITAGVLALMSSKARWRIPLALVAFAGLGSAASGYCLINKALGIDTTALDEKQDEKSMGHASSNHHGKRHPAKT